MSPDSALAMTQGLAILTALEAGLTARVPDAVVRAIAVEVAALDASPRTAAAFIKRRVLEHLRAAAARAQQAPQVTTIYPDPVWVPRGDRFHDTDG